MPAPSPRQRLLRDIARRIPAPGRPVLVTVDGVDGAGKTTFADELARHVGGRPVVRASVDSFHHPRAFRHALGRTGETFWSRSFDYDALRTELLDPWRRGSGTPYRTTVHDVDTDRLLDLPRRPVPVDGVLLVDGIFTQRDELAGYWDLAIFLAVPFAVSVARMAQRDGSVNDVGHPQQARYVDGQRIYLARCRPELRADVIVDNSDLDRPRVIERPLMTELLDQEEIERALSHELSRWRLDGDSITRSVEADSFMAGIRLVSDVAQVAEDLDHHPDIDIRWTTVTFRLSTHSAGGLTARDLRLAADIDRLTG